MKKKELSKEQKAILRKLTLFWKKHPKLTFGQIIWNITDRDIVSSYYVDNDIFIDIFIDRLDDFLSRNL